MKENGMILRLWGRKEEERAGLCKNHTPSEKVAGI